MTKVIVILTGLESKKKFSVAKTPVDSRQLTQSDDPRRKFQNLTAHK